jgi:hypothetical protein
MAIAQAYPIGTPKTNDLLVGTSMPLADTDADPITKNFPISGIVALANSEKIATTAITITNAQLSAIGDTPVEILPGVSGYIYQILGATAQPINAGVLGDAYDWQGQNGFISWRNTFLTNAHRVEIPNGQLPSGGVSVGGLETYVEIPIAGSSRVNSPLIIGVTNNTNPITNIGESPSATWKINLTYRLIQL